MSSSSERPGAFEPTVVAAESALDRSLEPATRHERRTLEQLHDVYGSAFQAYLTHVWEGASIDGLEEDFQNVYWGDFADRKAFLDSFLDAMDWKSGIEAAQTKLGLPEGVLQWNYIALYQEAQIAYDFYDGDGAVHVFLK